MSGKPRGIARGDSDFIATRWLRRVVWLALWGTLAGCRCESRSYVGPPVEALYQDLLPWMEDERPVMAAPDGSQYLIKTDSPDGNSDLHLYNAVSHELIGVHRGGWPLLISWRPDGRALSFVSDRGGLSQMPLFFWYPFENRVDAVPSVPVVRRADRLMAWSPAGDRLLMWTEPAGGGTPHHLRLVQTSPPYDSSILIRLPKPTDFKWSPDGTRIAVATTRGLRILEADYPDEGRDLATPSGPKRLIWEPSGAAVIVALRSPDRPASSLRSIDVSTGQEAELVSLEGEIDHPTFLTEDELAFTVTKDGSRVLHVHKRSEKLTRVVGFEDGNATLMAAVADQRIALVDHTGLTTPRALFRVPLDGGDPLKLARQSGYPEVTGIRPERIVLQTAHGALHADLWRAPNPQDPPGLVVRIPPPASPDSDRSRFSGVVQYVLRQGHHFVIPAHLPYDVEQTTMSEKVRLASVAQTAAAIDRAQSAWGVRREDTIVWGVSLGASVAIDVARRHKNKVGGLVIQGLPESGGRSPEGQGRAIPVIAFQGQHDPFSAKDVAATLTDLFGPRALTTPPGRVEIIPHEGHAMRLRTSRARVAAGVLQLLSVRHRPFWRPLAPGGKAPPTGVTTAPAVSGARHSE